MHDMRRTTALVIVLLGFVIAVAPVATAVAQPGDSPAAPQANPAPERVSDTPAPRNEAATAPAASPRTEVVETTRIFGLPVLAAALLAGVVLLAGVLLIASGRRAPVDLADARRDRLP